MTGLCGELCNLTGEVHPGDLLHSLDNVKSQLASVVFCRNTGAVIEFPIDVSINGFPHFSNFLCKDIMHVKNVVNRNYILLMIEQLYH